MSAGEDDVDVVLPTHARPHTVGYAVASVLAQTHGALTLHVVGDGCGDETAAALAGFADPRVRFHRFPKAYGFGYALRNRVLASSRAPWVAYMTDDDLWFPDHLERGLRTLRERNLDLVAFRSIHVRHPDLLDPFFFAFDWRLGGAGRWLRNWFMGAVACVHRRSVFETVGYWNDALFRFGDREFYNRVRVAPSARSVYVDAPTVLRFYAQHWDSRYGTVSEPPQRRYLEALRDPLWRARIEHATGNGPRGAAVRIRQVLDFAEFGVRSGPRFARFWWQRLRAAAPVPAESAAPDAERPPDCPACGGQASTAAECAPRDFEYGVRPARAFGYRSCHRCASEFLSPRPTREEVESFYPADYQAWQPSRSLLVEALAAARARLRRRRLRRLLGRGPVRLFDVGCGAGRGLDEMRAGGDVECAGVEINAALAAQARARGYSVAAGTLESLDPCEAAGRYDVVTLNHVLEHMTDPLLGLERALALLRPGGHAVGQLPALDSWESALFGSAWAGYHFPRHLQAFTRAGLAEALRRAGFERVRITGALHLQSAVSFQNVLVRREARLALRCGKWRFHALLLLAAAPFELAALAAGRSGVVAFEARKPLG